MREKGAANPDRPDLAVTLAGSCSRTGFGLLGQRELLFDRRSRSSGTGCVGSTFLLFSAAGGVGRIAAVDSDDVEVSYLHWQVIHTKGRRGTSKIIVLEYAYYLFSSCLLT